jgi:rhomboid protease GluP
MVFLLIFGFRAEDLFSYKDFFVIHLLSGFLGNVLTLLLMHPWTLSAGASGAIFGLFGACVIYLRKALGQSILSALIFSGFLLLLTSGGGNVNVLAHFGGLAAGLLIGYLLARRDHRLFHTNSWID